MTSEQIELVATSWQAASDRRGEIVAAFYRILFRRNPEFERLFDQVDMEAQRAKFAGMIDAILSLRQEPREVVQAAVALGERHADYGVIREYYAPAGSALLAALEEVLGPGLTAELRDAWSEGYGMISAIMCRAADRTARRRGAA